MIWFIVGFVGLLIIGIAALGSKKNEYFGNNDKNIDKKKSPPNMSEKSNSDDDFKPFNVGRLYKVYTPAPPSKYDNSPSAPQRNKTNCRCCGAPATFNRLEPKSHCEYCGAFIPEFQQMISDLKYHQRDTIRLETEKVEEERKKQTEKNKKISMITKTIVIALALITIIICVILVYR